MFCSFADCFCFPLHAVVVAAAIVALVVAVLSLV